MKIKKKNREPKNLTKAFWEYHLEESTKVSPLKFVRCAKT